jgi:hypothetical protein
MHAMYINHSHGREASRTLMGKMRILGPLSDITAPPFTEHSLGTFKAAVSRPFRSLRFDGPERETGRNEPVVSRAAKRAGEL